MSRSSRGWATGSTARCSGCATSSQRGLHRDRRRRSYAAAQVSGPLENAPAGRLNQDMTASQRPTPAAPPTFCSDACRAAGEPLFATAPRPLRRPPSAPQAEQPHTRIQLLKRTPPYPPGPVQFFVALAHLARPALYRFELGHYADLLDVDIEAILGGDPHFEPHRVHD